MTLKNTNGDLLMPGRAVPVVELNLKPPAFDRVESRQIALAEKDSLQTASIQVLTKRNEEANRRIQHLEELVIKKDEHIMQLVDIVIEKLGEGDVDR